jgi:formylglycine-generating enzyme required for sulfatase activity
MVPRASRLLCLLTLVGCQLVGGYEEFDWSETAHREAHPCDALPLAKDDALGLAVMERVDIPGSDCAWIDRTEVTVEQYQRWQDDVASDAVSWEPTWCAWKTTRTDPIQAADDECVNQLLSFDLQPFAPSKPMRCTDFCEAEAYCRWAGKHLCHDTSGLGIQGPHGYPQEWQLACTNGGTTRYPFGNDSSDACNTGQSAESCVGFTGTCGVRPAGAESECANQRGVMDLLGNVAEWVFACNYVDPQRPLTPTGCLTRGGGYDSVLTPCDLELTLPSDTRRPSLGFRCCADLTTAEELALGSTRP